MEHFSEIYNFFLFYLFHFHFKDHFKRHFQLRENYYILIIMIKYLINKTKMMMSEKFQDSCVIQLENDSTNSSVFVMKNVL